MVGLACILDVFFLEKTYPKTLLRKRASLIRGEAQNSAIHCISEEEVVEFKDLVEKYSLTPLHSYSWNPSSS
jgi:DHA1 family multidrug resistance protein-like MFS transporter